MSTTRPASSPDAQGRACGTWFRNRSVRTKIFTSIVLLAAVAAGSGAYAVQCLRQAAQDLQTLAMIEADIIGARTQIESGQAQAQLIVAQLAAVDDEAGRTRWLALQESNDAAMADAIDV